MALELSTQLDRLTDATLAASLDAAMVVSCADGKLSDDEINEMADCLGELTQGLFARDQIIELLRESVGRVTDRDVEGIAHAVAEALPRQESDLRSIAFLMAAATAWSGRGVGPQEGLALQALGRALGLDEQEYTELLAQGQSLANG